MNEPKLFLSENGTMRWRLNGKMHRLNGPAYIDPVGTRVWYVNDKKHRLGGPAAIWANGHSEWWVDGVLYYIERADGTLIQAGDDSRPLYEPVTTPPPVKNVQAEAWEKLTYLVKQAKAS